MVPFILCLVSFVLLFFSLLRHTKQMKLHTTGSRDPSIEAHMRAIKTIVIFLAVFIMYYVVFLFVTSRFLNPHGKLELMFGGLTAVIFPLSHLFILLMGNSKLREAFLKVLGIVKGFHKRRKYSVPQRILKEAERNQQKSLSLLSVVCIPFLLSAIGNHSYLPLF